MTQKLLLLLFSITLYACSGGDIANRYSCKITDSTALLAKNKDQDLKQCWTGKYDSISDAQAWCKQQVKDYLNKTYILPTQTVIHTTQKNGSC